MDILKLREDVNVLRSLVEDLVSIEASKFKSLEKVLSSELGVKVDRALVVNGIRDLMQIISLAKEKNLEYLPEFSLFAYKFVADNQITSVLLKTSERIMLLGLDEFAILINDFKDVEIKSDEDVEYYDKLLTTYIFILNFRKRVLFLKRSI